MGLSLFTGCVSEVAFFLYADAILKRCGLLTVFNGCVFTMGIRMLALSLLALPYQALFVSSGSSVCVCVCVRVCVYVCVCVRVDKLLVLSDIITQHI